MLCKGSSKTNYIIVLAANYKLSKLKQGRFLKKFVLSCFISKLSKLSSFIKGLLYLEVSTIIVNLPSRIPSIAS
jgi:hypothetical protein